MIVEWSNVYTIKCDRCFIRYPSGPVLLVLVNVCLQKVRVLISRSEGSEGLRRRKGCLSHGNFDLSTEKEKGIVLTKYIKSYTCSHKQRR